MFARSATLAAIAGCLLTGHAVAQPAPPCPADLNGNGITDAGDIVRFAQLQAAGDAGADFNGDGVLDVRDTRFFLKLWDLGCQIGIVSLDPPAAPPGAEVRIGIANLPGDCDPDDLCVISEGGVGLRGLRFEEGQPGVKVLVAEVLPLPPGAQPGPLMIGVGVGDQQPLPLPVPGAGVPGDNWVWLGDPQVPPLPGPAFEPIPVPPPPGEKFKGTFFFDGVGGLCLDLPALDWKRCDDIFVQFRAWCAVRQPDVIIPRIVVCQPNPDTKDVARAICDAIIAAFNARGIFEIRCEVIDLGNGRCRICLRYTDCDINGPAWQFQGPQPFALVCVREGAPDCDQVCETAGPTVVDVVPGAGNPGDRVCIFVRPGDLPKGIEAKDLCVLHSGGIVFNPVEVGFDPATGLIKITAEVLNVPPEAANIDGRIIIKVGDGECVDLPDPFPGACQVEPGFRWVPLDGFPVIGGGNFIGGTGDLTNKRFIGKWTLENGRQCLVIPRGLELKRCDSIEVLLRLWCPTRTPDINIPRILVCDTLSAAEFAGLLCQAITDAFTNGVQVPPINEIDCQVSQLPTGDWKVSLGYTDCAVFGGTSETGLPWTQVAVCMNDPICEEKCPQGPKPEIVAFAVANPAPGGLAQFQVINLPAGLNLNADDFCLAANGGQLFQPEFFDPVGNGQAILGARILPQGAGVEPGELMFRLGRGQRFMPQVVTRVPVRIEDPVWVWEPLNVNDEACPGPVWVPGGEAACGGEDSRLWRFDPLTGKLCLEIPAGLDPGCKISIFLRAYCPIRNPDVHIENICVLQPMTKFDVAGAICDIIRAAYAQAGIPQLDCTIFVNANGNPEIKLGYVDCAVNGPFWGPGGQNPSSITICCPPGATPQVKNIDNPNALPGEVVCMVVCDVPPGKGPEDWCLAAQGGQLFQVLDQIDLGGGMVKLFARVLPQGTNVIPGPIMIACGDGQNVPVDPPGQWTINGPAWVWQGEPGGDVGMGPNWNANGAGEPGIFCPGGFPTQSWTFAPTGGQLCLELTDVVPPGAKVSVFLRAYCDVRSPDVTIPDLCNNTGGPVGPAVLANVLCNVIEQAYMNAGIPQITCTIITNGNGNPEVKIGYTDCAVNGPTWGAGGSNPSTLQICP